eukprot:CAMPEP_0205908612 /NCGR_PEP_ID=MMETSP1325-20131115/3334_1 /ASSEMBLY_ACC=CAM_ASM_000708 /TAXON_ID=236786 /ORGANISM="Florenciella sp., Strain RCC1007" /LENGTH=122 /DNA_ID=CAMNT_0053274837 /DNA_START=18 /DNA_END=386 /DNA_ORIENTATION=-
MASQSPEPMTPTRAKAILKDTIETLGTEENKAQIQNVLEQVKEAPPEEQPMKKMQLMVPLVTALAGNKLQEHGLPNVMMGVMQIQMVAGQDALVAEGVQLLTACTMGNIDEAAIEAYLAKLS